MKSLFEIGRDKNGVDRYLVDDAGDDEPIGTTQALAAPNEADAHIFARCDAVMALTPRIAESPDVAWAFDEARRLARSAPRTRASAGAPRWYLHPGLAWGTACLLAVALIVTITPSTPMDVASTEDEPVVTTFTFAPIVISPAWAQILAEVEPVVTLANGDTVDSRSLAVLPFAGIPNESGIRDPSAAADSIYQQVLRQLAALPGIYLFDAATAAVYSETGLPAEEIALQMGVRGIVEGRVDAINGDIRFELRFTDAAAAGLSINQAIERPYAEIAMLQTDITSSVLGALTRPLTTTPSNKSF